MARNPEDLELKVSEKFQNRLKQIIDDQNCDKKGFAELTGVSKDVIIRAVNYGIIPSVKSLLKIANTVEVSFGYLLGETDENDFYLSAKAVTFHQRMEQLACERGEKFSAISNKMPFAKNSIYEWNRTGSLPSLEYLRVLSDYFDVSIDYLLGRTDYRRA